MRYIITDGSTFRKKLTRRPFFGGSHDPGATPRSTIGGISN